MSELYLIIFQPSANAPIYAWRETFRTWPEADAMAKQISKKGNAKCWIMTVEDPRPEA